MLIKPHKTSVIQNVKEGAMLQMASNAENVSIWWRLYV